MPELYQQVLRTNAAGMPLEWINYQEAVKLYYTGRVAYTCGQRIFTLHGGINSVTRQQSTLKIHSIIATLGNNRYQGEHFSAPLNNDLLFKRDGHLCMYCGNEFEATALSRDHIKPLIQGGQNTWTNVVTACKRCNNHKAGRTPEQANMQLLAVPFTPTHAEYIYLKGRRVLVDQMEFLLAHFPRSSPFHQRIKKHYGDTLKHAL